MFVITMHSKSGRNIRCPHCGIEIEYDRVTSIGSCMQIQPIARCGNCGCELRLEYAPEESDNENG